MWMLLLRSFLNLLNAFPNHRFLSYLANFININWPENPGPELKVEITRPGVRRYKDEMVSFKSPRGGEYWFLQPASIESSRDEGTDTRAIHEGNISIGSIAVEPALAQMNSFHARMEWRGI